MRWKAVAAVVLSAACGWRRPGLGSVGAHRRWGPPARRWGPVATTCEAGGIQISRCSHPARLGTRLRTALRHADHRAGAMRSRCWSTAGSSSSPRAMTSTPWTPGPARSSPTGPSTAVEPGRHELHPDSRLPSAPWAPRWSDEASGPPTSWRRPTFRLLRGRGVLGARGGRGHAPGAPWLPGADPGQRRQRSGVPFDARQHLQRAGLILLDGVVYAAFAGNCDIRPWKGWVFGVSTAGQITARWAAVDGSALGAGIWQTGGAPVVDGPGTFLVTTGNGAVITHRPREALRPSISARRGSDSPSRATAH